MKFLTLAIIILSFFSVIFSTNRSCAANCLNCHLYKHLYLMTYISFYLFIVIIHKIYCIYLYVFVLRVNICAIFCIEFPEIRKYDTMETALNKSESEKGTCLWLP